MLTLHSTYVFLSVHAFPGNRSQDLGVASIKVNGNVFTLIHMSIQEKWPHLERLNQCVLF